MPIVNLGHGGTGRRALAQSCLSTFSKIFFRVACAAPFAGAIVLASHLPGYGGILECNLWMGARFLLSKEPAILLAERWLKYRRQDLDFASWLKLVRKMRDLALELSALSNQKRVASYSHEVYRLQMESLMARLKFEQSCYASQKMQGERPTLSDYCSGFVFDARRQLSAIAQAMNVSLFWQEMAEEKSSFWTTRSGAKIVSENSFP